MADDKYLLGLDAGTTSIKGIIVDQAGNVLVTFGEEYTLETRGNDICELDVEIYWLTTQKVIRTLLLLSKIPPQKIEAIAFSSQGETLILIDKNGNPLRKAIVWMDNRSISEAREIKEAFGQEIIYHITGQPEIVPMWPATKILWLKKNEPSIFKNIYKILLVEDYLIYRLAGKYATEESLVSSSLYFDIQRKKWWDEMLSYIGISADLLPQVYPSGMMVGTLTKEAALSTGLSEKTIVVTGAYDHPAGAIGAGNIKTGIITETTGGAMAMCVTLDKPIVNPELNLPCQCHAIPDKYFLLPYGQTAGMVLKWFRDNFSHLEKQLAVEKNMDAYDLLTSMAAKVPPGSDGLIMLPHLMGTGSPEFDLNAKGVFAGITLDMTKGHFVRAIMEAVACMVKANIDSITHINYTISEIRTLGGGAKSDLWNQIKADMLGLPVITLKHKEVPSLGAAILAGVGTGVFKNIEDGCNKAVKIDKKFIPNMANKGIYTNVFKQYQKLYILNKPFWS